MKRRVVVTGMGAVSPAGVGTRLLWESITSGESGIDYITKFDTTNFPVKFGGEVRNLDAEAHLDKKSLNRLDDFTVFALIAADEAIKDAGLRMASAIWIDSELS